MINHSSATEFQSNSQTSRCQNYVLVPAGQILAGELLTMDSRTNAAKKRLLKQTQIWSGEVRSGKYLIQKGSTGGNSGELCKLLP